MERTKLPVSDGTILWQKVGGGSLRLHNRIIKPGQKFRAHPDDIPKGFKDVIIPLEKLPEKPVNKSIPDDVVPGKLPKYTMQKAKGKGSKDKYDIVDASGKKMNVDPLDKELAERLLKDLST